MHIPDQPVTVKAGSEDPWWWVQASRADTYRSAMIAECRTQQPSNTSLTLNTIRYNCLISAIVYTASREGLAELLLNSTAHNPQQSRTDLQDLPHQPKHQVSAGVIETREAEACLICTCGAHTHNLRHRHCNCIHRYRLISVLLTYCLKEVKRS